jgi:hypothetical protein
LLWGEAANTIPPRAREVRRADGDQVFLPRVENGKDAAVQTFSFWARPAIYAALWILAAALTLSELATIHPALESASGGSARVLVRRSAGAPSQGTAQVATIP